MNSKLMLEKEIPHLEANYAPFHRAVIGGINESCNIIEGPQVEGRVPRTGPDRNQCINNSLLAKKPSVRSGSGIFAMKPLFANGNRKSSASGYQLQSVQTVNATSPISST